MNIFKDRFELYNNQKLQEEREKRFYQEFMQICEAKCVNLTQSILSGKEKSCMTNCSSKLLKDYLPLYEKYI